MRFAQISLSALAALAAGAFMVAVLQLARSPGMWARLGWLWDMGLAGAIIYAVVPVVVLALLAFMGRRLSTSQATSIAVLWLLLIFAWWAEKPIRVYGELPWWGVKQYLLAMLPVPLTVGLVFSIVARQR